ncbi:hypothetical protein [Inconstantimicrobium mannanitabidum]|uniref:Uncharacterized protein n=1 Tax=Inconstantimicrobium mannanitabidum TaxID=1604901 RepID=A0ACB5RGG7_9CLOT|nr:hypothetical protein [Clostridium sp. TW13]GKX68178.1 hypothetical protein rsdtw13_34360 [Clostridium sp. TW13]
MNNYFLSELKRAIFSKKALISFLISIIALILPFILFIDFPIGLETIRRHYDAVDIFIRIRSTAEGAILVVIFPLLASLIFSDSYLVEKETKFVNFIYSRMSVKKYVFIKIIVTAISSVIVGTVSSFVMFIFLFSIFGVKSTDVIEVAGPFSALYYSNKYLYGILIITITGICYAVISELSLGLSAWIKNRYLVLIIPFFYYIFCGTLIEILGINTIFNFNFSQIYALNIIMSTSHEIFYPILLLMIGIILFCIGVIKREKDL